MIWLLQLNQHIPGKDTLLLLIDCNNQCTLSHLTTGIIKAHTKHINVCYHNSRDLHTQTIVDYCYMRTNDNVADILTKSFTKDKHV